MLIPSRDSGFNHPHSSEITPRAVYEDRRQMLKRMAGGAAGAAIAAWAGRQAMAQQVTRPGKLAALTSTKSAVAGAVTMEKLTDYKDASTYNNFYEFGTDKSDPAREAHRLKTRPWTVTVEGEVRKPGTFGIDDLLRLSAMEERIYRLRCVEGWSMVIPWLGFPLGALLKRAEPGGNARYVAFETLLDPAHLPGQRAPFGLLDWPYREGLRLDEAMHPLTLLAVGMYGQVLAKQNGAPLRLVVPWKYGFKSIKSIVRISLVERQPVTTWNRLAPQEYGFYSNVNPDVPHPRWSQATERRIGEEGGLFAKRRKTERFNGYEAQVGSLYAGMDLKKFF